jgi:hypothetical protein
MKGTKFTPDQMNEMLAAVDRLPDSDADTVATIFQLLAGGWDVSWPPPHHDEATSSSPITNPPLFQD